ncbi:MAG TPA: long-chain fatty acid--CoA ligase [Chromatiaceae bacterium]|nr:long-chain fatty acid--CoA ligase [Chromatiaceae bacterium]
MKPLHENIITPEEAVTRDGLFARRLHRSPDGLAYQYHDRDRKRWISLNWSDVARQVARWQQALAGEGLKAGDRVAVLLRNCPEWIQWDQAALSLGLVTVPLYTDDRPDNIAYILEESGVKVMLVQDAGRWKRLAPSLPEEGEGPLRRVVLLDDSREAARFARNDDRIALASEWLPDHASELRTRSDGDPHQLASIVYTSGTTGRPKGVMLSHHNMLSVAHGSLTLLDCYEEDKFLSFLPLSHTLERTAGYYLPVMSGASVAFSRSEAQLGDDLMKVQPTVIIAVPRIFEKVYGRICDQLEKKPSLSRKLFYKAVEVGWARFERQQGRAGWSPKLLLWPLLNRLVAKSVVARLGGRLRVAVSGGAPLSPDIARVFIGLGIPIVQGYGLTETSPVISVNTLEKNIPASVGLPIRGTEVKIGDHDELLVRGPGVMLGYWNNHKATSEVLDPDGWLHTGDQARIEDGHIFITGRIKDILVLSNGEKIPPADMELAIALDPLVEQVMVVGEGKPYLTALVVLNPESWKGLAAELSVDPDDPASLRDKRVLNAVLKRIQAALKDFPGYAKIRKVHLTLEPWTIEDGLITPTLKVKRPKVLERFGQEVEAMYSGGPT